jgi:hypothetical protein
MAFHHPDNPSADMPLLVAVHGGTCTSAYFGVACGPLVQQLAFAYTCGLLMSSRPVVN